MAVVELVSDQINDIVVQDLQCQYEANLHYVASTEHSDGSDERVLRAIEILLQYYMTSSEYDAWARESNLNKLKAFNQRLERSYATNNNQCSKLGTQTFGMEENI